MEVCVRYLAPVRNAYLQDIVVSVNFRNDLCKVGHGFLCSKKLLTFIIFETLTVDSEKTFWSKKPSCSLN